MFKQKPTAFIFFLLLFLLVVFVLNPYYLFLTKTLKISPLKTLFSLDSLKIYDHQVTVLILGIPGKNYQGGTLSDSIIVANYDLKTHQLLTISLPRDIWSNTLKDKINTVYAYGEAKQKNGGLKLAKVEVAAVIGIPIQYSAVIDFAEFKELVDFLGGIDVDIERSFTDNQFPVIGRENDQCGDDDQEFKCRYETVSFQKGRTHMDGSTALKYVRSRHATGVEGSDFARNRRQQKVLAAIKNELKKSMGKLSLKRWKTIYQTFTRLFTRDITNQQIAIMLKNIIFSANFSQKEIVLSPDFFLVPDNTSSNGQYILIPKDGNFKDIHRYIRSKGRQTP